MQALPRLEFLQGIFGNLKKQGLKTGIKGIESGVRNSITPENTAKELGEFKETAFKI